MVFRYCATIKGPKCCNIPASHSELLKADFQKYVFYSESNNHLAGMSTFIYQFQYFDNTCAYSMILNASENVVFLAHCICNT